MHDFLQEVSANKGIILKICHSFCPSAADREDLAQEILFILWKSQGKYNPEYKFSTWMYKVALNVAISFYRSAKKTRQIIPFTDQLLERGELSYEPGESDSQSRLLQKHVGLLKELEKALILLYFEEKSYKEIAEIIGISETNVATKVSRIKEKLKQNILNDQTKVYGRS